ncbi:MAG: YcxB family protein [Spirochaetales bacterium]|nr:YcxB family protein [Leptospiraceae bacterium]MCP5480305.1 YcxB family protein [Spirochaetales bacterium]MCP5486941.1 YcxB family protein [Spirochaetales bacterium]
MSIPENPYAAGHEQGKVQTGDQSPLDLPFEIEYDVRDEDVLQFSARQMKRGYIVRRSLLLFGLLLILVFVLWTQVARHRTPAGLLIPLGACVLFALFYPSYLRLIARRATRRSMNENPRIGWTGRHRLVVEREWIERSTENVQIRLRWAAVLRVEKLEQVLYVHLSSWSALVIPAHAFRSASLYEQFANTLEQLHREASGLA